MILDEEQKLWIAEHGTDEEVWLLHKYLTEEYYRFEARPDCPEEFDEQYSFVHEKWDGIACALAGNASGKTYAAAFKVAHFLRTTDAPTNLCKYYMASQSLEIAGTIWQEKLSKFITPDMVESITWYNSKKCQPESVILKPSPGTGNRWMICFRSYEQGRKSFQAISECGGFWVDEQIDLSLLNEIDTRTREFNFPGSKIYTLTPLEPDPELEERFNEPEKHPYWKFRRLNAEKNFEYGGIANVQWLMSTPIDMRETRRIGAFTRLSGAVFKEYDRNIHVIKPRQLSRHAVYFRSIDFGYSVDTHVLLLAEDGPNIYVTKEWNESGMRVEDKVKRTLDEMPGNLVTYADPEDAQQRREWSERGIHTTIARKEPVKLGLELIRTRFAERRLFIFDNCKKLISQVGNYRWKEPTEKGEDLREERPVKRNDHGVDALRMAIHSREKSSLAPWEAAKMPIGPVRRI